MPNPRCSGGRPSIRLPSSHTAPPVSGSRPARQFSAVDLPQPDGPSSATNSPPLIARSRPSSASFPPKLRLTLSSRSSEILVAWITAITAFSTQPASAARSLLEFPAADRTVPLVERRDLLLGGQRRLLRELVDPLVVLRPTELLDRLLRLRRRHADGHAVD